MANIRAMAIFQAFNNLPEDRFVNTFHFSNGTAYGIHAPIVADALRSFYETERTAGNSVGSMLSPCVNRAYEVRTYNLADLEPRVPTTFFGVLPAADEVSGLPEEVSIVLSYHGEPPVTGRRRGRIYIGPLSVGAVEFASDDQFSQVGSAERFTLSLAGQELASWDVLGPASWCIRSTVPVENFVPIVGGWVDGAPDTQRRRGAPTTIRDLWEAV
jgi:hypothetical protein